MFGKLLFLLWNLNEKTQKKVREKERKKDMIPPPRPAMCGGFIQIPLRRDALVGRYSGLTRLMIILLLL